MIQSPQNATETHIYQPANPVAHPRPPVRPPSDLAGPLRAAETSANRLQESITRIQQQIEANRADLRNVQHRIALQHNYLVTPSNGQSGHPHGSSGHMPANGQPATAPFSTSFNMGPFMDQMRQDPLPPHNPGDHTNRRRGLQHEHAANPATPLIHQPGAPVVNASQPNVQEFQGPNGERMTVVTDHMSFRIPFPRPSSAQGQRASRTHATVPPPPIPQLAQQPQQSIPPPPGPFTIPPMFPPNIHLPIPFSQTLQNAAHPSNTTAWLLSSPTGPQALLFAPGHGFFSSGQPVAHQQHISATTSDSQVPSPPPTQTSQPTQPPTHPPTANDRGDPNATRAVARAVQAAPPPAVAQARQNGRDNDLFGFLIQRGWLFLRLYLFMFVFSEPGTWKRWLMIIVAAIVCLQPRDGPLSRALGAARRHLDNLIGPQPQPTPAAVRHRAPDNPPGATASSNTATTQRPTNVRGAVQMTPEEAAARLLRERQDQNPRFWRDMFYRVEQSTALFLASLIPGVGERHVRAREEARREAQRIEEERRRGEEEAAGAQRQGEGPADDTSTRAANEPVAPNEEIKVSGPAEQSGSSSVQVRDPGSEAGEVRNRVA